MPWPYVRRRVAQSWGVTPWEVDAAPIDEVMLELKFLELEAEADKVKK